MNKLLAVYVGKESRSNLRVGLDKGIWGFKDRSKPEDEDLEPGDYILLGSNYTGGGPRTAQEEWEKHSLGTAVLGRITSHLEESSDPVWPDESQMDQNERYIHRVHFEVLQEFSNMNLGDPALASPSLSDALRRSGCSAGRGNVVRIEDFPLFSATTDPQHQKKIDASDLFKVLKKYADENVIFHSTEREAPYSVSEIESGKFEINRLGANRPVRIGEQIYTTKMENLQRNGGRLPFTGLDNTSAIRNGILQSRSLALSPGHKDIIDVSDLQVRLKLFCEIIENLRVAKSSDGPRLYKPAMLACVINSIDQGVLTKNEITFDFIAPRFIKKMAELGVHVTETQAAQPFYHLTGDHIWLHAVNDVHNPMKEGREGPSAARNKVKYALLKDTFWDLLQDWDAIRTVQATLERKWFKNEDKNPLQDPATTNMINSDFLKEASAAIRSSGLIYSEDLLRRFVVSLLAKPFVLLTGTSGTGKTQLALKFGQWLVGKDGYELVPVGADWTDNRQVLGHYNPFEEKFVSTRVLDLILRARDSPGSPFFLILDEMNLSHVERYFADFLSAMESGDPISLHRNGPNVKTASGELVGEEIRIPKNLFVVGTVNIDETTYMFSPKVLDRANVIEFSLTKTNLTDYMNGSGSGLSKPKRAPEDRSSAFVSFHQKPRSKETLAAALGADLTDTKEIITELFSILEGSSMEFGFRTPSEFLKYCEINHNLSAEGSWSRNTTCDIQILQKILPKLHGSRRRIESILVGLASYCTDGDLKQAEKYTTGKSSPSHFQLDGKTPQFPMSFAKLRKMIEVVQRDQFVSFIQ